MSLVTLSEALKRIGELETQLKWAQTRHDTQTRLTRREREMAVFWQGKFAIVKHENNALRRKLYRTEKGEGR